jgi:hypothetical protein
MVRRNMVAAELLLSLLLLLLLPLPLPLLLVMIDKKEAGAFDSATEPLDQSSDKLRCKSIEAIMRAAKQEPSIKESDDNEKDRIGFSRNMLLVWCWLLGGEMRGDRLVDVRGVVEPLMP